METMAIVLFASGGFWAARGIAAGALKAIVMNQRRIL